MRAIFTFPVDLRATDSCNTTST